MSTNRFQLAPIIARRGPARLVECAQGRWKPCAFMVLLALVWVASGGGAQAQQGAEPPPPWVSPGEYEFEVPAGIRQITIEAWGGGGGGGTASSRRTAAGGGGGGGYASAVVEVEPGDQLSIVVGSGGAAGNDGGASAVSRSGGDPLVQAGGGGGVSANNGSGGTGGDAIVGGGHAGGDGGGASGRSGGGGGAAGMPAGPGGSGAAPAGGIAQGSGGDGGPGGVRGGRFRITGAAGSPGDRPGGGGGGGSRAGFFDGTRTGGSGAAGAIRISWDPDQAQAPAAPENLRAADVGITWVELEWDPPAESGSASIQRYTVAWNGSEATPLPQDGTDIRISGLEPDTEYTFSVRATNADLQTGPAAAVTVRTLEDPIAALVPPNPPTDVQAEPGNRRARLSWTPPGELGSGSNPQYEVCVIQVSDCDEVVSAGAATQADIGRLLNGESYQFRVRTVTQAEAAGQTVRLESGWSEPSPWVIPLAPDPSQLPEAGEDISQVPLFLQLGLPPNILLIPDHSESMQERFQDGRAAFPWEDSNCIPGPDVDPQDCPAGMLNPDAKGNIVRNVGLRLIDEYMGRMRLGVMGYQQNPASMSRNSFNSGGTVRWRFVERAIDVRYSTNPNPPFYDPGFTGAWNSPTKRYRVQDPNNPNIWIFFNDGVPGYFWDESFTTGVPSFDQLEYREYTGGTVESNPPDGFTNRRFAELRTAPATANRDSDSGLYYATPTGTINTFLVDSQRQRGITSWGDRAAFLPLNHLEWRSTTSPGLGYLHVPIGGVNEDGTEIDEAHWDQIRTKLGPQRYDWNGSSPANPLVDPGWPLIASGLTPLEGTILTTRDYFLGGTQSFGAAQGRQSGIDYSLPPSCDVNAAIWVTDGLPSVAPDGTSLGGNPAQALIQARSAIAAFYAASAAALPQPVETYVVGFALPPGIEERLRTDLRPLLESLGYEGDELEEMLDYPLHVLADAGGTSRAFDADDPVSLDETLDAIIGRLVDDASGSRAAVASSSTELTEGTRVFQGRFDPVDWSGDLRALDPRDLSVEFWSASDEMPDWQVRNIFTFVPEDFDDGTIVEQRGGTPFLWNDLSADQRSWFNDDPHILEYLRGDRSREGLFRERSSVIGDIIHSRPAFQGPGLNFGYEDADYLAFLDANANGRQAVYVGTNAGMMHAVNPATGEELFAYVPNLTLPQMKRLVDPRYSHRFMVDGQQSLGHARFADDAWRTVLLGTLGAGERGIYALDVTEPDSFSESNVLWELGAADSENMGHVLGEVTIARLQAGGPFYAIFGNGYASPSGRTVLFVVNVETGTIVQQLILDGGSNGGLSTPVFRADDNATIIAGFAGDLDGRMWKFVPNATNDGFEVAFDGEPLFQAGPGQAITAKPTVGRHPDGGSMVFFGTGRFFQVGDNTFGSDEPLQSAYGIRDEVNGLPVDAPLNRGNLLMQEFIGEGELEGLRVRATSDRSIGDLPGWYLDLELGERIVSKPVLVDGRVEFATLTPETDPCGAGGTSSLFALTALTGGRPASPAFEIGDDGKIPVDGEDEDVPVSAVDLGIGIFDTPPVLRDSADGRVLRPISGTRGERELWGPGSLSRFSRSWIQLR